MFDHERMLPAIIRHQLDDPYVTTIAITRELSYKLVWTVGFRFWWTRHRGCMCDHPARKDLKKPFGWVFAIVYTNVITIVLQSFRCGPIPNLDLKMWRCELEQHKCTCHDCKQNDKPVHVWNMVGLHVRKQKHKATNKVKIDTYVIEWDRSWSIKYRHLWRSSNVIV